MSTDTLVICRPGILPPDDFLQLLQSKHKTCLDMMWAANGSVQELAINASDPEAAAYDWSQSVKNIIQQFKDSVCVFRYGDHEKDTINQPYPLIDNGKTGEEQVVHIAAMLEGDFPEFAKDDGNPNELHVVADFLIEAVNDVYKANGGDLDKTMAALDTKKFHMNAKGVLVPRGAIFFMAGNGKHLLLDSGVFEKGTGGNFLWGGTTRTHGYGVNGVGEQPKPEAPAANVNQAKSKLALLLGQNAPAVEPPKVEPKPEEKPVAPPPAEKPKEAKPPITEYYVPAEISGRARKELLKRNMNLPWSTGVKTKEKDWEANLPSRTAIGYTLDMLQEKSPLRAQFATFKAAAKAADAERETKDTPVAKSNGGMEEGFTGSMGPQTREHVLALINDGTLVADTKQIENLEKPYDSFTSQCNINEDVPIFWGPDRFLFLCQHNVPATASLLTEFAHRIAKLDPTIVSKMMEKLTAPPPAPKSEASAKAALASLLAKKAS